MRKLALAYYEGELDREEYVRQRAMLLERLTQDDATIRVGYRPLVHDGETQVAPPRQATTSRTQETEDSEEKTMPGSRLPMVVGGGVGLMLLAGIGAFLWLDPVHLPDNLDEEPVIAQVPPREKEEDQREGKKVLNLPPKYDESNSETQEMLPGNDDPKKGDPEAAGMEYLVDDDVEPPTPVLQGIPEDGAGQPGSAPREGASEGDYPLQLAGLGEQEGVEGQSLTPEEEKRPTKEPGPAEKGRVEQQVEVQEPHLAEEQQQQETEQIRLANEQRRAKEKKLEEERLANERLRLEAQQRQQEAEQKRLAEEQRQAEEKKLEEERLANERLRLEAQQRQQEAEQKRLAEEQRQAEEKKLEEERLVQQRQRLEQQQAEQKRLEEEQRQAREKLAEERRLQEQRSMEEQRQLQENRERLAQSKASNGQTQPLAEQHVSIAVAPNVHPDALLERESQTAARSISTNGKKPPPPAPGESYHPPDPPAVSDELAKANGAWATEKNDLRLFGDLLLKEQLGQEDIQFLASEKAASKRRDANLDDKIKGCWILVEKQDNKSAKNCFVKHYREHKTPESLRGYIEVLKRSQ